jgi:hypothetical protein
MASVVRPARNQGGRTPSVCSVLRTPRRLGVGRPLRRTSEQPLGWQWRDLSQDGAVCKPPACGRKTNGSLSAPYIRVRMALEG